MSKTALKVARTIVFLAQSPETGAVLPENAGNRTALLLLSIGLLKPWMLALYRLPTYRKLVFSLERGIVPGLTFHFGVRKRYLDDQAALALSAGARQVLCVGAGFDTLCLRRAPSAPGVRFVEIDHPGTSMRKRQAVESIGAGAPNFRLLGADLSCQSLEAALSEAGWDPEAASVVIAEGVLMYLPEPAVSGFLQAVRTHTAAGSWLFFTHLVPGPAGGPWLGRFSALAPLLFRLLGEPFRWWLPRDRLGEFLERHGYRLESAPSPQELSRLYCPGQALSDVDLLAVART
ncbi:MAG: SAM-dependent methyltransferase [Armatimonadetes bacterium]|nr:SAM-dependent methyltransferase [Armatimonadota bacterium]